MSGGTSRSARVKYVSPRDGSVEDSSEEDQDSACSVFGGRAYHPGAEDDDDSAEDVDLLPGGRSKKPAPSPGVRGLLDALSANYPLACCLVFIPFGFISHFYQWDVWLVFTMNFMAILPMAWLIGKSTEDLAAPCGDVIGGLLNATFGNVVEMLLCIAGIRQKQIIVVQCTLVGSILSNLLLVLGTAFLWGGYWYNTQTFNKAGAACQSSLMLLAVLTIVLPTVYSALVPGGIAILEVSRGISVLMFLMYFQYLYFQLVTHSHIFEPVKEVKDENNAKRMKSDGSKEDEEDDEETPSMTACTAAVVLGTLTIMTSMCAEYLIGSIQGTIKSWNVTPEFIGVIILPIIGNAAEHYSAIVVAGRKKMDLALNIALGSACQMAILVTPFTVLTGWAVGTDVTLDFHPFQASVLLLSVIVVANVLSDGAAYWLEGSMLFAAYIAIAMIYFFDREDATYFGEEDL